MSAATPERGAGASRALLVTVAIGIMVVPLNSTMIAVALPRLIADFETDVASVSWLVTGYLVAMAGLQPLGGRLGDRIGRRGLVLGGLAAFALASALAATAGSLEALIAWRVVQAVSGALMFPNGIALLREAVPSSELGGRVGMVTAVLPLAAAAGPPLGGVLLAVWGWQAIFLVNLPLLAVALALGWRSVPARAEGHEAPHLGLRGAAALVRRPAFAVATAAVALSNLAMYVTVLAVPLLLARRGGWSDAGVGLALGTMFVAAFALTPLGGRLADTAGRRAPALAGLGLQTASVALLAVTPDSIATWELVGLLVMSGCGIGLSGPALQVAALEAVPAAAAGIASGAYSTSRYLGSIAGTTLLAGPLAPGPGLEGFSLLFVVLAGSAAASAAMALLLPGRAARAPHPVAAPAAANPIPE